MPSNLGKLPWYNPLDKGLKEVVVLEQVEGLGQVRQVERAEQVGLEAVQLGVHGLFAAGPRQPRAPDPPVFLFLVFLFPLAPSSLVFLVPPAPSLLVFLVLALPPALSPRPRQIGLPGPSSGH